MSKLKYHIRVNQTNINGGFFSPDSSEHWYWPVNGKSADVFLDVSNRCLIAGLMVNDVLYIMAYNVYADGGGPFGFAFQGTTVIRVTNPNDDPDVGTTNFSTSLTNDICSNGLGLYPTCPIQMDN